MTRTVALIQARMSSTRLPGKVLAELAGQPLLVTMVHRARRARLLDEVVVVTSTDASDDPIATVLAQAGLPVYRGELHDVLQRYATAATASQADEIVRLTGDCPLIDPQLIDAVVAARRSAGADYATNTAPPSFPDGLDVECFTRAVLDRAARHAALPSEREHVTPWMRNADNGCVQANVQAIADFSGLRLTVDYADDLEVVRELVAALGDRPHFDLYDMLRAIAQAPDRLQRNAHARNEGLAKSLAQEGGPA